jgi:Uma2 family endonuclease
MSIALAGINPPLRILPDEPISVADFWSLSAENPELRMERHANGEIFIMTPTRRTTGFLSLEIARQLGNWAEQDGRGYAFDSSTGFTLPDSSVLSPDAAWIDGAKWHPGAEDDSLTPMSPDFVIELRSKTDRLTQSRRKMQMWIDNGVALAWLIDPSRKTVEIYRPGKSAEEQEGHSAVDGEGPVGGFVLELGRVWG